MVPIVYFLVVFSIVVHGLSIPALDAYYRYKKIEPITEDEPTEIRARSIHEALPNNASVDMRRNSIYVHNRFSRPVSVGAGPELYRWNKQSARDSDATFGSTTPLDNGNYAAKLHAIQFAEKHSYENAHMR